MHNEKQEYSQQENTKTEQKKTVKKKSAIHKGSDLDKLPKPLINKSLNPFLDFNSKKNLSFSTSDFDFSILNINDYFKYIQAECKSATEKIKRELGPVDDYVTLEFTMKLELKRLYDDDDDEEEEFEYLQNKLYKIKIIQDSILLIQYDGDNIENDNNNNNLEFKTFENCDTLVNYIMKIVESVDSSFKNTKSKSNKPKLRKAININKLNKLNSLDIVKHLLSRELTSIHFYKDLYVDITMGDILFCIEPDSLNTKKIIFHDDDDYASNNNN
jgi:hypothetical protein